MSVKQIREKKSQVRKQLLSDIQLINAELSGLKDILRMKQKMLRKTNQDMFRISKASSYLDVIQGEAFAFRRLLNSPSVNEHDAPKKFKVINGGSV